MRKGWLPTALAVFAMAASARADAPSVDPLESVIVIIGEASTTEPAVVTSLPAMTIEGDLPRPQAVASGVSHDRNAFGSFVIDPGTGLAVPRMPHDTRAPFTTGPVRAPAVRTRRVDPATGLMVPDFIRTSSTSTGAGPRYVIDRRTGLMIPDFRGPSRAAPSTTASGMVIDRSTGLMIPAAFVTRRNRGRVP